MRSRFVRSTILGLVFAFPLFLTVVSRSPAGTSQAALSVPSVLLVEAVLAGGVVFAVRERRRLLLDLETARSKPRWVVSRPTSALSGPKVAAKRRAYGLASR